MVVGITGGIGSGKTTVVNLFLQQSNVVAYFSDIEAKKIMHTSQVIKEKLIQEFSGEVYANNELNRKFLAGIVFSDKKKLQKLNAIVHPEVHKHFQAFVSQYQDKDYILYENAILFENGSDCFCDKIITVTAPIQVRIDRVVKRDATSADEVLKRMKNQWKDEKKMQQSHYIITNVDLEQVALQVCDIHNKLTKK